LTSGFSSTTSFLAAGDSGDSGSFSAILSAISVGGFQP
jgi:hypothetical protein